MQLEEQKRKEKEIKMLQNKAMRDRMLQDAKIKSENEQHRAILEDKALAEKLIT